MYLSIVTHTHRHQKKEDVPHLSRSPFNNKLCIETLQVYYLEE